MTNGNRSDDLFISGGRIVAGICIVVVAGLIMWLCASTVDQGERISVIERSYEYILRDLRDLKTHNQRIEAETKKMTQQLGILVDRFEDRYGIADKKN